ncbi:MAG: energy-coupling factor transporter transmembrane protein EcfT [Actinobacteria bacterium]|nr:energy-coupling factor transporter transmembrane protein EcfT [Actinomycetota bacterium]
MKKTHSHDWHPLFWWLWACAGSVMLLRNSRADSSWIIALSFSIILAAITLTRQFPLSSSSRRLLRLGYIIALVATGFRMIIAITLGVPMPGRVLFQLPQIDLPNFLVGITIGGPVTSQRLAGAMSESLVFAGIVILFATANALTTPHRLLRVLPSRLHGIGLATSIATSVAPQSAESFTRVRQAHRLRGRQLNSWNSIGRVAVPVLEESLERSIDLAVALESRGYGYFQSPSRYRRLSSAISPHDRHNFAFMYFQREVAKRRNLVKAIVNNSDVLQRGYYGGIRRSLARFHHSNIKRVLSKLTNTQWYLIGAHHSS